MSNFKRAKFNAAIKRLPRKEIGKENLLSENLPAKIGSLEDKNKITIRLDARLLNIIKEEADHLGVGYQKLINDRLLELYSISEASYLKNDSSNEIKKLTKNIEDLNKRLRKIERTQEKKQA